MSVVICLCNVLLLLVVSVTFSQQTYTTNENDEVFQPVIVLSNPAAFDVKVRIRDARGTATS